MKFAPRPSRLRWRACPAFRIVALDCTAAVCDSPDMPTGDQFGSVLRRVRIERGLTQEQLAEVSGLHRTEISLLERSQRKPLLETVVALCRGLGLTPAELLHEVKI